MESNFDELSAFIGRVSTTQKIVGGMVEILDMQDYAFMDRWRYNHPQEIDSDQSSEEDENFENIQEWWPDVSYID